MSFHLRHIFNIDVAAIATIVLSVALIVYVLLSIWGITGFPEKRHSSLRYRRTTSLAGAAVCIPLTVGGLSTHPLSGHCAATRSRHRMTPVTAACCQAPRLFDVRNDLHHLAQVWRRSNVMYPRRPARPRCSPGPFGLMDSVAAPTHPLYQARGHS